MPVIGRERPADIVLNAPQVSARHCVLQMVRPGVFLLTDLGSRNGTFVNGRRVRAAFVRSGEQIGLGSYAIGVDELVRWAAGDGF